MRTRLASRSVTTARERPNAEPPTHRRASGESASGESRAARWLPTARRCRGRGRCWAALDATGVPLARCSARRPVRRSSLTDRRLLLLPRTRSDGNAAAARARRRTASRSSTTARASCALERSRARASRCCSVLVAARRPGRTLVARVRPVAPRARPPARGRRSDAEPDARLSPWPSSSRSTPAPPASARSRSTSTVGPARARTASSRSTSRDPGWVEHDAEEIWAATLATLAEVADAVAARRRRPSPRSASPTSARRPSSGTARRARRATARSSGRTAAPPRVATSCARRATSRSSARGPGSCSIPTSPATKLEWLLTRQAASTPTPTSRSAPSTAGSCGGSPAARPAASTRPTRRTRAARCCSTSTRSTGRRSCSTCSVSRASCLPRGAAEQRRVRRRRDPAARPGSRCRSPGSRATSRPRCSARRASTPGMTKNTYGTGSFVLVNLGAEHPPPSTGLLTSVGVDDRRRRRRT